MSEPKTLLEAVRHFSDLDSGQTAGHTRRPRTKGRPAMTTDEAVKYLSALAESEWRFLSDGRGHALKPIRVVLAELATLRENAGRLADAASPFLLNRHRHEKSNNGDICYLCGEDIRHQCHYLAGESWPSQIEGLRAALAPFAERKEERGDGN